MPRKRKSAKGKRKGGANAERLAQNATKTLKAKGNALKGRGDKGPSQRGGYGSDWLITHGARQIDSAFPWDKPVFKAMNKSQAYLTPAQLFEKDVTRSKAMDQPDAGVSGYDETYQFWDGSYEKVGGAKKNYNNNNKNNKNNKNNNNKNKNKNNNNKYKNMSNHEVFKCVSDCLEKHRNRKLTEVQMKKVKNMVNNVLKEEEKVTGNLNKELEKAVSNVMNQKGGARRAPTFEKILSDVRKTLRRLTPKALRGKRKKSTKRKKSSKKKKSAKRGKKKSAKRGKKKKSSKKRRGGNFLRDSLGVAVPGNLEEVVTTFGLLALNEGVKRSSSKRSKKPKKSKKRR